MIQMNANRHFGSLCMGDHLRTDHLDWNHGIMRFCMIDDDGDIQFFGSGDEHACACQECQEGVA